MANTWHRPSLFTVGQPVFPAFVLWEVCESGLCANWVMLQESSRVGTSPTSLQAAEAVSEAGKGEPWEMALVDGDMPHGEDSRLGPRILMGLLLVMDWEHV